MAEQKKRMDGINKLIPEQRPDGYLPPKWMKREPEPGDFGLDGINLSELYRARREFEKKAEKEEARLAEEIRRWEDADRKVKNRPLMRGYIWMTIIFGVLAIGYAFLFRNPDTAILLTLGGVTTCLLLLVIILKLRDGKRFLTRLHALEGEKKKVKERLFPQEEVYQSVFAYAAALCQYEYWQKRKGAPWWNRVAGAPKTRDRSYHSYRRKRK